MFNSSPIAVHEDREKVLLDYEKQMRGDDQGTFWLLSMLACILVKMFNGSHL